MFVLHDMHMRLESLESILNRTTFDSKISSIACQEHIKLGIHHMHILTQPGAEASHIIANKPHLPEWGCSFIMAVLSAIGAIFKSSKIYSST